MRPGDPDDAHPGAPPFPKPHRREFVVWDDIDALGMPRDAFDWQATYLRTKSTGMLHSAAGHGQCRRADMTRVVVPLVSEFPDTASRCSKCVRCGEAPPRPMQDALALVGRLKWLADLVAALEARVRTLGRADVYGHRRQGPLTLHISVEVDARVAASARRALAELEARRALSLAKMERRLSDDRSDIDDRLDALVTEAAADAARRACAEGFRRDVWPLLGCVDGGRGVDAERVWRIAADAWSDRPQASHDDRAAAVDEAIGEFLAPPVVNAGALREGELLVTDGGAQAHPCGWLDAEFLARRRQLALAWVRRLDAERAVAVGLRSAPDRLLVTTDWDEKGPTGGTDLDAILASCPHVSGQATAATTPPWMRVPPTAALVLAPAVLARWLDDGLRTFDMGPADGRQPDEETLHRLMAEANGRLTGG